MHYCNYNAASSIATIAVGIVTVLLVVLASFQWFVFIIPTSTAFILSAMISIGIISIGINDIYYHYCYN